MLEENNQPVVAAQQTAASSYKRLLSYSVLNILSCFAVVMLHVTLVYFSPVRNQVWYVSLFWQVMGKFSVPVFFMLSGANLLGYRKKYSTEQFLSKRVKRVVAPLIISSFVLYLIYGLFPTHFYGAQTIADTFGVQDFIRRFCTNQICDVYWFLYSLVYLYVLTPLLSYLTQDEKLLKLFLLVSCALGFVLPTINWFHDFTGITQLFAWSLFTDNWLFYYVLGYFVANYMKPSKRGGIIAVVLLGVSLAAMYCMARIANSATVFSAGLYFPDKPTDNFWTTPNNILAVIQAVTLFYGVCCLEPQLQKLPERVQTALNHIAAVTFGIYLFHYPAINWLGTKLGTHPRVSQVLSMHPFIKGLVIFCVVGLLVWCYQKVFSLIRKLVCAKQKPQASN